MKKLVMVMAVMALVSNSFAATLFTEDFSGLALPSNMEEQLAAGSAVDYSGANVAWGAADGRGYVRTIESDYLAINFVAEGTVDILDGASPGGVGFFGLGTGSPSPDGAPTYGIPAIPNVHFEIAPDGFADGFVGFNDDHTRFDVGGTSLFGRGSGWDGIHRVRLTWDAVAMTALMEIDQDYAGGAFVADYGVTLDGSDNGFDATNSHIFFGGGEGVVWDDISVVPEPATMLLLGLGGLGLLRRKRA